MARLADPAVRQCWEERIRSFERSGLTVAEFCEHCNVSTASFYLWRRRLRDADARPTASPPAFVPVTVREAARECFRIRFASQVTVEVPAAETETLLRVVDRLAAGSKRESQQ